MSRIIALTLDQAILKSDLKGRMMRLGKQLGPFSFSGLFLITGVRMDGLMDKRQPVIDAAHVASGKQFTFTDIGTEFALMLFSNYKV